MDKEENKNALPDNEEEKKGENGIRRKQSEASVASLDVNNEDDYDDGDEEEDKDAVALGPVLGLKEQMEKDKVRITNMMKLFFSSIIPSNLISCFF